MQVPARRRVVAPVVAEMVQMLGVVVENVIGPPVLVVAEAA
jgi:hypothetical protein